MRSVLWMIAVSVTCVTAQEKPPAGERTVRLELRSGEVVEGRLDGFADRTYRVRGPEGTVREVHEEQVARLELRDEAPSGPRRFACDLAAEVLARARSSGALRERVLGAHRFLVSCERSGEGAAPAQDRHLLLAQVEEDEEGGERLLRIELELLNEPGNRHHLPFPAIGAKGRAVRVRWWIGQDARARRAEALSQGLVVSWTREQERWVVLGREGQRSPVRAEWPWHDDLLPEAFLALVLAPLHDQGLPPSTPFRLLEHKAPDGAATVRRLRLVPGERQAGGAAACLLELATEEEGEPEPGSTRLFVATAGPARGRLVRLEQEERRSRCALERIDETRVAALLADWKCERAPAEPAPLADPPDAAAEPLPPPDEVAGLIAATRRAGKLVPWERWYLTRGSAADRAAADRLEPRATLRAQRRGIHQVRLLRLHRVALRHEGERTILEEVETTVGDPAADTARSCSFDAEGRLISTWRRSASIEVRGERRGARLQEVWVRDGREERRTRGAELRAGEVPELAATHLLPCLESLPGRLAIRILYSDAWELRPAVVGSDGLAQGAGLPPIPFPPGTRPTRACRIGREVDGRFATQWLVWLGEDGDHLGITALGGAAPELAPQDLQVVGRIGAEEAAALARDERAITAAAGLRAVANEEEVGILLQQLHGGQAGYRAGDPDRDGQPDFAESLAELVRVGLAPAGLSSGVTQGYRFELVRAADAPGERWLAVANPVRPGVDGTTSFAIAEDGRVLVGPGPIAPSPDARPPAGLVPDPEGIKLR